MNLKSLILRITQSLDWHPERCLTFSSLVVGLINHNNVQHHALSLGFKGATPLKSRLERIRRFFAKQVFDYGAFARAMVLGLFKQIPKMHLILDRTNWKFGKKDINYLILAGRVGKVTFPLFYKLLPHRGCSDLESRIELLEKFRDTFGFDKILSFTADREFIGKDWLLYLCRYQIPFLSALRITA